MSSLPILKHIETATLKLYSNFRYTSDQRFKAINQPHTEDWILQIKYPQHRDSGQLWFFVLETSHLAARLFGRKSFNIDFFLSLFFHANSYAFSSMYTFFTPIMIGIYECQVSTTPHMSHFIHLNVVGEYFSFIPFFFFAQLPSHTLEALFICCRCFQSSFHCVFMFSPHLFCRNLIPNTQHK